MIKIGRVVAETHPHFAYWCETKHGFQPGDIVTTHMTDPPPDKDIFVIKEVIDDYILCTNKAIAMPAGKYLRKLTTVSEITAKMRDTNTEKAIREQDVRDKMRELYLTEPFDGTVEERLLDGYLYIITQEDLTLPEEERKKLRGIGIRVVMAQTGKAGILEYIKQGKRQGLTEALIAKTIWIEMIVEGVQMYVSIKNIKITEPDEKRESE